jgi:beta-N-acetylhexosaminidase
MSTNQYRGLFLVVLLCLTLLPIQPTLASPLPQAENPETRARNTLNQLTPEEKIGQLFLVSFQGSEAEPDSQIVDLVTEHFIGGVILSAENDNFTNADQILANTWGLTNQLQTYRYEASQSDLTTEGDIFLPEYIPLFIGMAQEGDSAPNSEMFNGVTPLPSQMAIGATWNPELAKQVGQIAGEELSNLGINLLFGPSLDITEIARPEEEGDLSVRVFGGDPFWVGEMGRAYVDGLHQGSNGRLAVVGTHFPGLGGADRLPKNEVATVRKTLEQLKQIDLAPFFVVTGDAQSDSERVDGLLVSHIRYQGLQGNIRSTTRPISFDQQALSLLMELPSLASWRQDGGVMVSDDLGSRAVRRFYDPTEETFNARRLALDAFLAGNDLLYLNNFISSGDPDVYTTITKTLDFFTQKYVEDPVFAQRVDESVLRILTLKYRLYGLFTLGQVLTRGPLNGIGTTESRQIVSEVAQRSATLISPPREELENLLPSPPGFYDRIVFITDTYKAQQCSGCPLQNIPAIDSLERSVLSLYGPNSGGQVSQFYLKSYSSTDLTQMLNGEESEEAEEIKTAIQRANWIVFTILDINANRPESLALQRFLAERPDLLPGKKIIVFAANAPYYLDSTNISKLTAYFGIYSKIPASMDVAARLLFREITTPEGSLPVSVPGIGYNLMEATGPKPDQVIPLSISATTPPSPVSSPEIPETPNYQVGDIITMTAGKILDQNNHAVPDGTPVQFIVTVDGQEMPAISENTLNGVVQVDYLIEQSGFTSIQAKSGSAASEAISFQVPPAEEAVVTPTETATTTPTESPSATSPPPTPQPTPVPPEDGNRAGVQVWFLANVIIFLVAWGASRAGALIGQVRWGIRWALSAVIAGLLLYTYTAVSLPGTAWVIERYQQWGLLVTAFVGALLGWGVSALFFLRDK